MLVAMLEKILRFIGYTAAIAFSGAVVLILSVSLLPENRQPTGISLALMFLSVVMLYGSPIIAGAWLWRKGQLKVKQQVAVAAANASVQSAAAARSEQQEALKLRYFERERLIDSVDKHKVALRRNLERAVRKNDYGVIVDDRRSDAIHEFFASIDLNFQIIDLRESYEVVFEQLEMHDTQV